MIGHEPTATSRHTLPELAVSGSSRPNSVPSMHDLDLSGIVDVTWPSYWPEIQVDELALLPALGLPILA